MTWNIDTSYKALPKMFYRNEGPREYRDLKLLKLNELLAKELGLDVQALKSEDGIKILAGAKLPEGVGPISQAYAGHQFGHFTMLGDGRAMLLGEHITPDGKRYDIHLKGSGRTVYSRGGDGKAAVGPMLREYIISEAMYELGIPTTRALSVIATGEDVYRENLLPGAVLARVASSHLRVGTFQFAATNTSKDDLKALTDYAINRHYPFLNKIENEQERYLEFLEEVVKNQAKLVAKWMLVGFIHGVMNTDNVTISGETIDYGPCAFMDIYDQATVFSSIDYKSRYSYEHQPSIAVWDLSRLADAMITLFSDKQDDAVKFASEKIKKFDIYYYKEFFNGMRKKLGLLGDKEDEDRVLVYGLLALMEKYKADYTNTFIDLTFDNLEENGLTKSDEFKKWYDLWKTRLSSEIKNGIAKENQAFELMKSSNPAIIPRNSSVEEALEEASKTGKIDKFEKLLKALKNPFEHNELQKEYREVEKTFTRKYKTYCGT
ncbi:protein adenylyltransferase SelO [Peptostreptococcus equinus]|uniref:Protein nucleotidyltransferase YdiU n=1 Tax=Peptostreptococcus equinus TaxID=3003601 RepID=A0ABY7JN39_9FIRM|nr:YdiU family protein [Peptostreptococcus sp. CBA3647]WAW14510.1 YdiU family protein [Peptostreptococcus sp. CBA3647]